MQTTGTNMTTAAETLRAIANSEDGQQGRAIDRLRETVGDTHILLQRAGEMYYSTATALNRYATTMVETGPAIDSAFEDAKDAWTRYDGLEGDRNGTTYFLGIGEPEPGSPEAEAQAAQDQAKYQAFQDWMNAAADWDAQYDTWEEAWDAAVDGIEDAFDDDVKDGWTEWLETLGEILGWVGLIVGIAAMIIGGPIVAAIAAAVAVLSLAVTLVQAAMGDKTGWDITIAVIGIIPIGKLGKLAQSGRVGEFFGDTFASFRPSTYRKGIDAFREADSFADYFRTSNPLGRSDVLRRLTRGESITEASSRRMWYDVSGMLSGGNGPRIAQVGSNFEGMHKQFSHWFTIIGYGDKVTGSHLNPRERFPALDLVL